MDFSASPKFPLHVSHKSERERERKRVSQRMHKHHRVRCLFYRRDKRVLCGLGDTHDAGIIIGKLSAVLRTYPGDIEDVSLPSALFSALPFAYRVLFLYWLTRRGNCRSVVLHVHVGRLLPFFQHCLFWLLLFQKVRTSQKRRCEIANW